MCLGTPWHVESSWTKNQTHAPCVGSQILIHCTTREVKTFDILIVICLGISLDTSYLELAEIPRSGRLGKLSAVLSSNKISAPLSLFLLGTL